MKYIHIFTDGVDKLLSTSIWFEWYGGKDAFCFYEKNALKGFIEEREYIRLAGVGRELYYDTNFIHELLDTCKHLTTEVENVNDKAHQKGINNKQLLFEASYLLKSSYRNYFFTEEYYTNALDPEKDTKIIESIGKFRYEFITTCIKATEAVYELASRLVGKEAEFYKIDEILQGDKIDVTERKKAFLLRQIDHKLRLFTGQTSVDEYNALFHSTVGSNMNQITGMAASKGTAIGNVYKISLTSKKIAADIENMPQGAILVTESTQPHMILACKKASAIITDEGGILSHAAIICREFGIPCVVGTRIATQVLQNNDTVKVNGVAGIVKIIKSS